MSNTESRNIPWVCSYINSCGRALLIGDNGSDIVQEIGVCAAQYKNNYCETNQIPAMTHQCAAWETCMNRDPATVGRARIGAELIAEVVNGFVEPISWKTLVSLTVMNVLTALQG